MFASRYPRNATPGACSELRKDSGARNERRWTSYPRNATPGACSELGRDAFRGNVHVHDVNRVFRHNNVFIANLVDL